MSSSSNVAVNVTVDDFDAFVSYSASNQFSTPDPSNEASSAAAAAFYERTFHLTETTGAWFGLNFTGTAVSVYGASGPAFGSYEVSFDGKKETKSAYAATNSTPFLLYSSSGLPQSSHSLVITNLGKRPEAAEGNSLLLDYLSLSVDVGASGAELKNTTLEETDPALKFTGRWGNNTSPAFSGGGTTFTQEDGATVSLTFKGSAVYVYGDTNANHGLFTVEIDNSTVGQWHGTIGCGLTYMTQGICEKIVPGLNFFAAGLDDKEHTIKITNNAGANRTFLDIDRFVYTTPSKYLAAPVSNSPSGSGGSGTTTSGSSSPSTTQSSAFRAQSVSPSLLWGMLLVLLLFRKFKL